MSSFNEYNNLDGFRKLCWLPSMVVMAVNYMAQTCHWSIWEAEVEESLHFQGQVGLDSKSR